MTFPTQYTVSLTPEAANLVMLALSKHHQGIGETISNIQSQLNFQIGHVQTTAPTSEVQADAT